MPSWFNTSTFSLLLFAFVHKKSLPCDFSQRGHPKNQLLKTSILYTNESFELFFQGCLRKCGTLQI